MMIGHDEIYFHSAHEPGYIHIVHTGYLFVPTPKDIRYVIRRNTYRICGSPLWRAARCSFACYRNRDEITVLVCEEKPYPLWFSCRHKLKLSGIAWTPIQYVTDFTFVISVTQQSCVTEIEPNSPFLCVKRIPIRYGFRAGTKAIHYGMNIYSICDSLLSRWARRSCRCVTEIEPKSPFLCMNRSPIREYSLKKWHSVFIMKKIRKLNGRNFVTET